MVTGPKLTFMDIPIHTQWASKAERWGRAHRATGQKNTGVLCSVECSLALSLSHAFWPYVKLLTDPKYVTKSGLDTTLGTDIVAWSVSSVSLAVTSHCAWFKCAWNLCFWQTVRCLCTFKQWPHRIKKILKGLLCCIKQCSDYVLFCLWYQKTYPINRSNIANFTFLLSIIFLIAPKCSCACNKGR